MCHKLPAKDLPPLLSGMLAPEISADEDITQLINDIHRTSRNESAAIRDWDQLLIPRRRLRIIWIAAELEDTIYARLKNRSVRTGAAEENLRWHFEWATKDLAMPQRAEDVPAPVSPLQPPS